MGLFAAGNAPTSTADPFGLRRIAYGMLQASKHRIFLDDSNENKQASSSTANPFELRRIAYGMLQASKYRVDPGTLNEN